MIGWINVCSGLVVVPLVIVCDLGAQAAHRDAFFFDGLWGGQLAHREERSDERDNSCFGLESLIQPLIKHSEQRRWKETI